jgi:signal transduction histidine kinase
LLLLIEDLTELSHQRDLAQRHSRLSDLGEMAALVAHEIRNPLGGIKGFASLLKRDLADRPELEKLASYILEATEGLSRLVNDILEYSQPVQLHKAPTDLVKLIEELLLHLNADESIDPRIELHSAGEAAILIAPVDAQALKLALLNLCTNAFHAMTDGGELCIACRRAPESCQAILTVSDSGPGIAPELLPKLFSPLFTTRSAGHGFGLTEVEKIIKAHGGTIGVISTPDAGTTFTIKLPLDTEE